jgi:hypothetical protein
MKKVIYGPKILEEYIVNNYNENKKVRRIASVIYIILMAFIVIGTTLSEQQKAATKNTANNISNP